MAKAKQNRRLRKEVGGDQNVIQGNISGGVTVQGRQAQVSVQQTTTGNDKELSALFDTLYKAIQSRAPDPSIDKEEISETVQRIEQEVKKGDQANDSKLNRWMENLNKMAPDIIDVILASLGGPVSGVTAVLKKVAEHARQ